MAYTISEINNRVQELVENSHSTIIVSVMKNQIKTHNEFCDCDYCDILKKYVKLKKNRWFIKYMRYRFYNDLEITPDMEELHHRHVSEYKNQVKQLKLAKDSIKENLIRKLNSTL